MERVFKICDRCGAWREVTHLLSAQQGFSICHDYADRFFMEEHLRCLYPAQREGAFCGFSYLNDSDPGFVLPASEKEWIPEKCPSYRPPQEPVIRRKNSLLTSDFVGCWMTQNVGGLGEEIWIFREDSRGKLVTLPFAHPPEHRFTWQLISGCELILGLSGAEKSSFIFFKEGKFDIHICDETNRYGERHCFLYFRGTGSEFRLIRKDESEVEAHIKRLRQYYEQRGIPLK